MAKASDNEFPKVTFAESAAPATPASGLAVVYVKSDGKLYLKDDAGAETDLTASGVSSLATYTLLKATRTAGDVSVGTSTAAVDTGLDLVLTDPVAGQWVKLGISGFWDLGSSGYSCLNMATMNGSTVIAYVHDGGTAIDTGIPGWFTQVGSLVHVSGDFPYQIQSADIISTQVTFRLFGFTSTGTRPLRANTNDQLSVWCERPAQ